MESDMAAKLLEKLFDKDTIAKIKEEAGEVNYLSLLSMANGAIRPSGASYRDALSMGEFKDNGNEVLNDFLKDTIGYMVFRNKLCDGLLNFVVTQNQRAILSVGQLGRKLVPSNFYLKSKKDLWTLW